MGRLFPRNAVVSFGVDDPNAMVGRSRIQKLVSSWWNTVTKVCEPATLVDPPGGFTAPDEGGEQHYVVTPVLIHDDPFVVVFDMRGGEVATHMVFEPFEPIRF